MPLALVPVEDVSPGILGFTVVFALGLTLYFLIRSMNKHISRIQAPSEKDLKQAEWERRQSGRPGGADDADGTDGAGTAAAGERADRAGGAEPGEPGEPPTGEDGDARH